MEIQITMEIRMKPKIAGRINLAGSPETQTDDKVTALAGIGDGYSTYTYCHHKLFFMPF
jgi:hypothetical protein